MNRDVLVCTPVVGRYPPTPPPDRRCTGLSSGCAGERCGSRGTLLKGSPPDPVSGRIVLDGSPTRVIGDFPPSDRRDSPDTPLGPVSAYRAGFVEAPRRAVT